MINYSNLKYCGCLVLTGTVKKGISQVILPCPHSVLLKKISLKDSISKIFVSYIMILILKICYGSE